MKVAPRCDTMGCNEVAIYIGYGEEDDDVFMFLCCEEHSSFAERLVELEGESNETSRK